MPNHIQNKLVVEGVKDRVKELFDFVKGTYEDGTKQLFDFRKIIPPPVNIFNGDLSSQKKAELNRLGIPNWYDWNTDNWNTKWNAYQIDKKDDSCIEFQTAWKTPAPIWYQLSKLFSDLTLYVSYADEDIGYNCGRYTLKGGVVLSMEIPKGGTKEAYELAFEVSPEYREYYELVDGEYRHIEEEQ